MPSGSPARQAEGEGSDTRESLTFWELGGAGGQPGLADITAPGGFRDTRSTHDDTLRDALTKAFNVGAFSLCKVMPEEFPALFSIRPPAA